LRVCRKLLVLSALLGAAACEFRTVSEDSENSNQAAANQAAQPAPQQPDASGSNPQAIARARQLAAAQASEEQRARLREQARMELQDLRVVVDISDRELRLFQGEQLVRTHPVAVGSDEWPTPTGSWQFHRVDLNPEWIPPNEEWAKEEERTAPGDPDNPMGRARLVYRMPNTVHGTDDLASLGKAVSHGSIRVANEVALDLAEVLLKAGGAWEGPRWFQHMVQNRTTEYQVDLADPIPIRVQE
jgi:lipoprotein-anchoring transpeptidase ErfK/SrfK